MFVYIQRDVQDWGLNLNFSPDYGEYDICIVASTSFFIDTMNMVIKKNHKIYIRKIATRVASNYLANFS